MGNLGGGEILVILLVALIVLGPTKLPPAIRQVGKVVGEIRRIGQGFQQELREAAKPLQEATADLKAADKSLRETTQKPLKEMTDTLKAADPRKAIEPPPTGKDKAKEGDKAKGGTRDPASGKGGETLGTAAAGPVSWGTAEANVSPPPAASSQDTDAVAGTTGAVEPDAESVAVEPDAESVAVEPDAESVAVEPDAESVAVEPDAESVAVEPDAESVAVEPDAEPKTDGIA